MHISDAGLRLIKSFEGYHTRQPDGSCVAYLCPAGVPTIGWGCTEGVHLGMRWTAKQAEDALRRELEKFEAGVARVVTVELNQNELDALVSFAYNVGLGALGKSSLLRRLNAGDRDGAANAFASWTRGGGRVLPGLVSRRARESALFRKPVAEPEAPFMAQKVEAVPEPPRRDVVAAGAATAGGVIVSSVPPAVSTTVENVSVWRGIGEQVAEFASWTVAKPMVSVPLLAAILVLGWWLPKRAGRDA